MITSREQTHALWSQVNEELCQGIIENCDSSSGNLWIYISGPRTQWVVVCAGAMKIASIPEIKPEMALNPQYFVGHTVSVVRPTFTEETFWDVEPADAFMSIDNVSMEIMGQHFQFLLQIEKFGLTKFSDIN
jgi:hypothetical protein